MDNTLGAILKLYDNLGRENPDIISDIKSDRLTQNEARSGRSVIWYMDGISSLAIYEDNLELLSDDSIDKELL